MAADFDTYDAYFRNHFFRTYASEGNDFADYEPAYRYGFGLPDQGEYRDADWSIVEPDARQEWEQRFREPWEKFKDAVRHGWDARRMNREEQGARP
jgi:hypothetical protein